MKKLLPLFFVAVMFAACGGADTDGVSEPADDTTATPADTTAADAGTMTMPPLPEPTLGDASLIAIGCPDLEASMAFYEQLGFHAIQQGDEPYPWAWMTDSTLLLGLFQDGMQYMGMSYYTDDLASSAAIFEEAGWIKDEYTEEGVTMGVWLSPDSVAGIAIVQESSEGMFQPNGATLLDVMNSPDPNSFEYPNAVCGVFGEYAIACENLDEAIGWWEAIGFTTLSKMTMGEPYAILSDGINFVGLHQTDQWENQAITYFKMDATSSIAMMKEAGYETDPNMPAEFGDRHAILKTPEGQQFFMFSFQ